MCTVRGTNWYTISSSMFQECSCTIGWELKEIMNKLRKLEPWQPCFCDKPQMSDHQRMPATSKCEVCDTPEGWVLIMAEPRCINAEFCDLLTVCRLLVSENLQINENLLQIITYFSRFSTHWKPKMQTNMVGLSAEICKKCILHVVQALYCMC